MAKVKKLAAEYRLEVLPEDVGPEGMFASGDDDQDAETVKEIRDRLENGDEFAWFVAHVVCLIERDGRTFKGDAYLGGCSYRDERDFKRDGYWEDMCDEAYNDAIGAIRVAAVEGQIAKNILDEIE